MSKKLSILIVDDEPDVLDVLSKLLSDIGGYEVFAVKTGKEAMSIIYDKMPHLILLDLMLKDISGYELCKQIKSDVTIRHLPIMILTGKGTKEDEIRILELGIDDYIVKPIEPDELLAKIKSIIQRTYLELDANPLTRLPGNNSVIDEIEKRIIEKEVFALCYIDLDNFKAFNDHYGFNRGDEVIRLTAKILIEVVREIGSINDFIGHIGGDDFILITTTDKVDIICPKIIEKFDAVVPQMYTPEDIERGYILTLDRQGILQKFPVITMSIGVVTNEYSNITHHAQMCYIANEMKQYAKSFPGSNYFVNRRGISAGYVPHTKDIKDQLWKTLLHVKEDEEDKIMGIPTIHAVINTIKNILSINAQTGLLCIRIDRYKYPVIEEIEDFDVWDNILMNVSTRLKKLHGKIFRKDDIITSCESEKENIYIILSPPRYRTSLEPKDMEGIVDRISHEVEQCITQQDIELHMGYSLITRLPQIPLERLIYHGLHQAAQVAWNKAWHTRCQKINKLKEIIINKRIHPVFQPVVELTSKKVIGYEMLIRGEDELELPAVLFSLARQIDAIWALEYLSQKIGVRHCVRLASKGYIFFNMDIHAIGDPKIRSMELLKNGLGENYKNVVIELSIHNIIKNFRLARYAVGCLRAQGISLSIDNITPSYETLKIISVLSPEFVKLDTSLIKNIHNNPLGQKLLKVFVKEYTDTLEQVIAVGIEQEEECNFLKKSGVRYGQGYLFGKYISSSNTGTGKVKDEN